jgi:hypothetical protein
MRTLFAISDRMKDAKNQVATQTEANVSACTFNILDTNVARLGVVLIDEHSLQKP